MNELYEAIVTNIAVVACNREYSSQFLQVAIVHNDITQTSLVVTYMVLGQFHQGAIILGDN